MFHDRNVGLKKVKIERSNTLMNNSILQSYGKLFNSDILKRPKSPVKVKRSAYRQSILRIKTKDETSNLRIDESQDSSTIKKD